MDTPSIGVRHVRRAYGENMQTETTYRGLTIKRVKNFDPNELGCMGFTIDCVYQVVDDLDDLAIPHILQQTFWSPYDCKVAIDFALDLMPAVNRNDKYRTSIAYEFNRLMAVRRNVVPLMIEIAKLKDKAQEALEFDDPVEASVVLESIGRMEAAKFMR